MLGIGLGVVMEKYYKFDGRSVTGDELVSLAHCLTAEGQKAQTKCARATNKLRNSEMARIKLEDQLTESRKEKFRLKDEVEKLREQMGRRRIRVRFKTACYAGIASYLAASLIMWNLDISEWSVDCRAACVMAALSIAVLVETIEYFKDDR